MVQVMPEVAYEQRLALAGEADRRIELGARPCRHDRLQEMDVARRHVHVDEEVGAREREEDVDALLLEQDRVERERAGLVVQDGDDERRLVVSVHNLADDVRGLVPVEGGAQHLQLKVRCGNGLAVVLAQRVQDVLDVPLEVCERPAPAEVVKDLYERRVQPRLRGVVAAVRRRIGGDVLRRDRRAQEHQVVMDVGAPQDARRHRVEERLRELRPLVLDEEADVEQLRLLPHRVVDRVGAELGAQALDVLEYPLVVEADALLDEALHAGPGARRAEQPVVPVEPLEQLVGDSLRDLHAGDGSRTRAKLVRGLTAVLARYRRRVARVGLAQWLGLGLALAVALVAALPGGARTRPAALAPCASIDHVLCAYVSVPLDYAHPKGRHLRLFVTARPKASTSRGTVLLLAGGPGEASTTVFDLTSDLWRSLFPGYTVAAYDDRGTGDSASLSCRGAQTAERCGAAIGPSRAFYGTRENVQDMDAVRRALGVDRITLFGLSYGTKQALAYALTFPDKVERLLLDSVVPVDGPQPFGVDTLQAIPAAMRSICHDGGCAAFSRHPGADLTRLANALAARPLDARVPVYGTGWGPTMRRLHIDGRSLLELAIASDLNAGIAIELPRR